MTRIPGLDGAPAVVTVRALGGSNTNPANAQAGGTHSGTRPASGGNAFGHGSGAGQALPGSIASTTASSSPGRSKMSVRTWV